MKKHLKVVSVIVGIMMVAGLLYAAAGTSYQYLKKGIEQPNGSVPECWRVEQVRMKITGDDPYAIVDFQGWKDFETFRAGKPAMGEVNILVEHIDTMQSYPIVFQELMGRVLATDTFYGAEFVEVQ